MSGYIGTVIEASDIEAVKNASSHCGEAHTRITAYIKNKLPGYPTFYCASYDIQIPEQYRNNDEDSIEMKAILYHMVRQNFPGKNAVIVFENERNAKSLDESRAYQKACEYLEEITGSNIRRYITAYAVTRHYGGPEEGGWWYNRYTSIESVELPEELHIPDVSDELEDRLEKMKTKLYEKHAELEEGNIYSMLGGTELSIIAEPVPNSNQTMRVPHYE